MARGLDESWVDLQVDGLYGRLLEGQCEGTTNTMTNKNWWDDCKDPKEMIDFAYQQPVIPSKRKGRLLSVALCKMISHLFWEDELPHILTAVEDVAEGKQKAGILHHTWTYYRNFLGSYPEDELATSRYCLVHAVHFAAKSPNAYRFGQVRDNVESAVVSERLRIPLELPFEEYYRRSHNNEVIPVVRAQQADLIREVLGHPIGSEARTIHPTPDMIRFAQEVYDGNEAYVGILADSLEDEGYAHLTAHLRTGKHIKGCWVVDLILGKK